MTETTRPDARTADGNAPGERWLAEARAAVAQGPAAVTRAFALAGRQVGRAPVRPDTDPAGVVHGTVDDAARADPADALRTNDQSLVAAAVGPFAAAHLDPHAWRHAVLKLVFMGVSLDAVAGLDDRADDELARMARDFAAERRAAGRVVPDDVARLAPDVTTGRTA